MMETGEAGSQPSDVLGLPTSNIKVILLEILEDCCTKGADGARLHVEFMENNLTQALRSEWEEDPESWLDFFHTLEDLLEGIGMWLDETDCPEEPTLQQDYIIYIAFLLRILSGCLESFAPDHSGMTLRNATYEAEDSDENPVVNQSDDGSSSPASLPISNFWRAVYWNRDWMVSDEVNAMLKEALPNWSLPTELLRIAEAVIWAEICHCDTFANADTLYYASVLVYFWAICADRTLQEGGLSFLGFLTLFRPKALEGQVCLDLHRIIEADITWQAVEEAILRDLQPETCVDLTLRAVCATYYYLCIHTIRPTIFAGLDTELHRRMFVSFLAAFRRHCCLVPLQHTTPETHETTIERYLILYLRCILWEIDDIIQLPEKHLHSVLALIARCIPTMFFLSPTSTSYITLKEMIEECTDMVQNLQKTTLRRYAYRRISIDLLFDEFDDTVTNKFKEARVRVRLPHAHELEVTRLWRGLSSSALNSLSDVIAIHADMKALDAPSGLFSPLRRCCWDKCLCSIHKPPHRMRVCTGCYKVAYCGLQCQFDDWEVHKDFCSKSRMPRLDCA